MRVLITGAGGQLGRELALVCDAAGDTVHALSRADLDVTSRDAVLGAITSLRPDVVINAAAWTAVDACESDPDRASVANALSVRWLADGCRRAGAHLVHVSTDYVFDGTKPTPYDEFDVTNPQSVYGRSKLAGEHEALGGGIGASIARTSWVCGAHGNNMVKLVLRLMNERPELAFVDDQIGCPTFTADLAPALRRLALDRSGGVYHLSNAGPVSWFGFVREIVQAAGGDPAMVRPITTAELQPPRPAPRPANSVLANTAWAAAGYHPLRDFREPLAELVRDLAA